MTRQELRVFLMTWFCGCGAPEAATASLLRLLEQYSDEHREADGEPAYKALPKWIPDKGIMFLTLYWLTDLDLIEHGGGVLASWLTGKGQAVLEALRREKEDGFEALHASFCAHGYDLDDRAHDCMTFEAGLHKGDPK
jgi:hypothetical protein